MKVRLIATMLATSALLANSVAYGGSITCRSDGGYERCSVDTAGGVELQRELDGRCREGRSWGYDPGGIWVDDGCAASFEVADDGGGAGAGTALAVLGALALAGTAAVLLSDDDDDNDGRDRDRDRYASYSHNSDHSEKEKRRMTAISMCTDYAGRIVKDNGGNGVRFERVKNQSYGDDKWRIEAYVKARWPDSKNPTNFIDCTVDFDGNNKVRNFRHDGLDENPHGSNWGHSRSDRRDDRELAVRACENEARREDFHVRDIRDVSKHRERYNVSMILEKRRDRYQADCRYNIAHRDAELRHVNRRD
jgi:hypothetical protein